MDWYFGRDDEDLTVPKDDVIFDSLPSPDSWPSWVNIVGSFNSQKKLNALGVEELLSSEPMFHRHAFRQQIACASDHSDVQLSDLPKIEEADDIFFDSLFRVDAGELEGSDISYDSTQTSGRNDVMAVDLDNHIRDNTNDVTHLSPLSPEKLKFQEKEAEICMAEERSDLCENISDYISLYEPVLLELQNMARQLSDSTRICFRDSLYRLAENSRCQTKFSHSRKQNLKKHKPSSRLGASRSHEFKAKESDTKAIDRTVATLLFTTMKFCNSAAAVASTSDLNGDTLRSKHNSNARAYQLDSCTPSPCNVKAGDAEVPTVDMMNQPFPQLSCTLFSRS